TTKWVGGRGSCDGLVKGVVNGQARREQAEAGGLHGHGDRGAKMRRHREPIVIGVAEGAYVCADSGKVNWSGGREGVIAGSPLIAVSAAGTVKRLEQNDVAWAQTGSRAKVAVVI